MSTRAPRIEDAQVVANGETPALPRGSERAAQLRAQRDVLSEPDPVAELQAQYQQLALHVGDVMRDKQVAQQATEMATTLLAEARNQLAQRNETIGQLAAEANGLRAELDALYDAHPELVPDEA